jgi:hypothetical protein
MDPLILDASSLTVFALWIVSSGALIANIIGSVRRAERVRANRSTHDRKR